MGLGNRKDVWYGGKREGGQETAWDWVTERAFGMAESGKVDRKLHGIRLGNRKDVWYSGKWQGGQEPGWDWGTERTIGKAESGKVDKKLHMIG